MSNANVLLGLLEPHLPDAAREWFFEACARLASATQPIPMVDAFSVAGRKLGNRLVPTGAASPVLARMGLRPSQEGWPLEQLGRMALLACAEEQLGQEAFLSMARECYQAGDARERAAVLRVLPLLTGAADVLPLALDACRSHVQPIFEAIACENGYPAAHFTESSFNQMVLKAVFIGVPLARVVGLESRLNPELSRMATDYAREREAAGRPVPEDLLRLHAAR